MNSSWNRNGSAPICYNQTRTRTGGEKSTHMHAMSDWVSDFLHHHSVSRSLMWHVSCVCGWRTRFENEGIGMYQIRMFKHQLQTPMDCVLLNEIHQSRRKRTIRLLVSRPVCFSWVWVRVCLHWTKTGHQLQSQQPRLDGSFFLSVGDSNYYLICRNLIFSTNTRGSTEVGI